MTNQDSLLPALKGMDFSIEEYLRTVFDEKLFIDIPEAEDKNLTNSTKLLEKYKELKSVNTHLRNKKEEFRVKMENLQHRRNELEKKECELKESLIKFDRFFKDNDDKKLRAIKKLTNERFIQQEKQKEMDKLNQEIRLQSKQRKQLKTKVEVLTKYRKFLESVVDQSQEFSSVWELIARYDALKANLEDLKTMDTNYQHALDEENDNLYHCKETGQDEKFVLTNEIGRLRTELESQQADCYNKETQWEFARNAAVQRIWLLITMKIAINNMYRIVRTHQKYGEEARAQDLGKQLRAIKQFTMTLQQIVEEVAPKR